MDLSTLSVGQYDFIANAFSFGFAVMAAATLFLWFSRSQVAPAYKMAVTISGLVTAIAGYHYLQIMLSWDAAFSVTNGTIETTGYAFNQAYRYVDWLLTVPLLLVELILVMRLSRSETVSKSVTLGGAAALMIILGYPGEVAEGGATRFLFWVLSMIPFIYIVYQLVVGLKGSISKQPENVRGLIRRCHTGGRVLAVLPDRVPVPADRPDRWRRHHGRGSGLHGCGYRGQGRVRHPHSDDCHAQVGSRGQSQRLIGITRSAGIANAEPVDAGRCPASTSPDKA
nr:bacteriorhodopsin-like [Spiribacter roseus]